MAKYKSSPPPPMPKRLTLLDKSVAREQRQRRYIAELQNAVRAVVQEYYQQGGRILPNTMAELNGVLMKKLK